jgi:hypothetical protein
LWMWVAYNCASMQCTLARTVYNGFQAAGRAVKKQLFGNGVIGHCVSRGG